MVLSKKCCGTNASYYEDIKKDTDLLGIKLIATIRARLSR